MPAPRVHVHQKYRSQPIDLQPYGNTISVEAESDNPFEDDRDVEVYTQASGGMAGPDPRVRSRGLLTQRPRGTRHQGGKVRAFQVTQDAAHPGFMPGMGDLSTPRGQKHAVRRLARDPGFVPGMGADPVATTPAPAGSPTWLQAIQAAGTTAGGITGSIYGAKTSAAQAEAAAALARAEQARADQMRSQAMLTNMGAHPLITYGALAVAALAVGYIVLKKKRK